MIGPDHLLLAADLAGTLLFAIEGASAAIRGNLDLLDLLLLAFAVALGGGITRDVLIAAVPPASLRDWRYAALAFSGAALTFILHRTVEGIPPSVLMVLDAAGLSLFAMAGTRKALLYSLHPFIAICWELSQAWVAESSATFSWRRFRMLCAWIFMPRLRGRVLHA